ncbi:MAG: cytochrome c biogenesis protein CcdA [Thermodesulfobacteriota bacterium]
MEKGYFLLFENTVTISAAFGAGLLSFLTPCVFPLIPVYFTLITGLSLEDLTTETRAELRLKVFISTVAFVLGFSTIFVVLGGLASFLGGHIIKYRQTLQITGGVLIIVLGVHLIGIIRIPWLETDKRFRMKQQKMHFVEAIIGAFVAGMAFSAGWTPCIGPILGSILIIAGNQQTVGQGVLLLTFFSAGLALPFLLLSVFIDFLLEVIKKGRRLIRYINPAAGALLIAVGVLLLIGI